jgi:hypothetical protein
MVTMRNWIDRFIERFLNITPKTVEHGRAEEVVEDVEETTPDLDVLAEHGVSVEQVRNATQWLRNRREEYLNQWKEAESEYERIRDRAREAEGPKKDDLLVEAEDKLESAEDRRRQWEQVAARFQLFRQVERHIDRELEKKRFETETGEIMENLGGVMESLAEELEGRRRAEDEVATSVEQNLEKMKETGHQKPDVSRAREDMAEERLSNTELGVGTGYGEDLLEDEDEDDEEFRVETGGDTL